MVELSLAQWLGALAVAFGAGYVKGTVGFAMPLIIVSGIGSFLAPELALAALVFPTFVTNFAQAIRGGVKEMIATARDFARYILIVLLFVALSAQLVTQITSGTLFLLIGIPVLVFSALQLFGARFSIRPENRLYTDVGIGGVAGFLGGISGVWGPPTVLYLTALNTPKDKQMRVQGIVYGAGAIVFLGAHVNSGVITLATAPLSAVLVVPALLGMVLGFRLSDRLDQGLFRKVTLVVLVFAALNLIRRGLTG